MRDKVENIVQAIQTKEDEIYESLIDDEVTGISMHEDHDASLFRVASSLDGMASVTNLLALDGAVGSDEDNASLKDSQNKLVALLGAKIKALEALISLQNAYCDNVEIGDDAGNNELGNFNKKLERYASAYGKYATQSSETGDLLGSQIDELSGDIESISKVFADYNTTTAERSAIFANFSGK